jgi:hypothetical protein
MSSQYKVCPLFWNDSGDCYRLRNQNAIEELLNDGWKISRVDTMSPTEFQSGTTVSATNVYILEKQNEEKQSEDTKKSSVSEFLPHGMGLRVELDTNETCYLKSGWKERCGYIYGLAVSYTDGSGIVSSRPDNPVPIAIMNSHVRLAVSFEEYGTETTK